MEHSFKQKRPRGVELFFITPIILGGSPTSFNNKIFLDRLQHIQAVRYWNKIISDLRGETNESKCQG